MTDNEKRAHDLTTAIIVEVCNLKKLSAIESGAKEIPVDYFAEYMALYEASLEAFNKKFPNGK